MKRQVYISSCDREGGVYHFAFEGGKLTFCEKTALDRPMYAVIADRRLHVLLRETDEKTRFGGLISFELDENGRLIDPTGPVTTHGVVPCHLCAEGNDLYAVNYLSGNVVRFPDTVVSHTGKSVHPTRQTAPHTHFVTVSPDKRFVLCTDLGLDTVFVYTRDLESVSSAKVPAGSGCRHLCFHENRVYCVNELTSDVSVFAFENGILTYLDTFAAIPGFRGESAAAAIRVYDGRLYVSHRGADCISCFAFDGGALRLLWNAPCGGHAPRDFAFVDGFIVCANEGGNVSVLKPRENGAEILSNDIKMPDPLCVTVQ